MDVVFATEATPGRVNEDHVVASASFVVVLDGVTVPDGVDTGCRHDVPWLVRNLGELLASGLTRQPGDPLTEITAEAIRGLRRRHEDTCDLANPDSPSATIAMLRVDEQRLEYLVLCDSLIILESPAGRTVVTDDRTARLTAFDPASVAQQRNAPDGFWVASTDPDAARQALTGSIELRDLHGALVMTDGAARLVDRFGKSWSDLTTLARAEGPRAVLRAVRAQEHAEPPGRRGKRFDDATLVVCEFPTN